MPAKRVKEAATVAREVAERLGRMRVARQSAVQAVMTLTLAQAYLHEYARLLEQGLAEDDALVATMETRIDLGASQPMLMRMMFAPGDEA
jgi:hypothetical protein